jgi:hypothetical protein
MERKGRNSASIGKSSPTLRSEAMSPKKPELQEIAPVLQGLRKEPDARINYDLFADALIWSDEFPRAEEYVRRAINPSCMRGILNFRTSLILEHPREKFRAAWEEAKRLFPDWPGFSPERQSSGLKDVFSSLRDKAMRSWEEFEAKFDSDPEEKNGPLPGAEKTSAEVTK